MKNYEIIKETFLPLLDGVRKLIYDAHSSSKPSSQNFSQFERPSNYITIDEAIRRNYFSKLETVTLYLTNRCNLSCSYCFEQHTADFQERFTPEKIKQIYDFLYQSNDLINKTLHFFGGEPLFEKETIFEFIEKYKDELEEKSDIIKIVTVTNGLMLNEEFIDKYFSYGFTSLVVSLDTIYPEYCKRELNQTQINHILKMIEYTDNQIKEDKRLCVRCTTSREHLDFLDEYITLLHDKYNVRTMIVHPLNDSLLEGRISWTKEELERLTNILLSKNNSYKNDTFIQFCEGVCDKERANCLTAGTMMVIDPEGDISGCYFITSNKALLHPYVIGNIFRNEYYYERYDTFNQKFSEMLRTKEKCINCNTKNICYQCPAANLAIYGTEYMDTETCQNLVSYYCKIENQKNLQIVTNKLENFKNYYGEKGKQFAMSKTLLILCYMYYNGTKIDETKHHIIESYIDQVDYNNVLKFMKEHPSDRRKKLLPDYSDSEKVINFFKKYDNVENVSIVDAATGIINKFTTTRFQLQDMGNEDYNNIFYTSLLHVVMNDISNKQIV